MDTVLKSVLISGAAVLLVVGIFAFVQLQSSQLKIEDAERAATELGQTYARKSVESGRRVLLAAAYGWGPSEIPGFDMRLYRECLADIVELCVFEDFGDVVSEPSPEDHYKRLTEHPKKTWVYAVSFNREILRTMPSSALTGCRAPQIK